MHRFGSILFQAQDAIGYFIHHLDHFRTNRLSVDIQRCSDVAVPPVMPAFRWMCLFRAVCGKAPTEHLECRVKRDAQRLGKRIETQPLPVVGGTWRFEGAATSGSPGDRNEKNKSGRE